MSEIIYPTTEKIIEYNLLVLKLIRIKKADEAKVLSKTKIMEILDECEEAEGDIYEKAVYLLKGLIQKHPFASGNRRTAFIVVKEFLLENHASFHVQDDPHYAKVMQGLRENYYATEEIKEWIKHGKIRDFKR